MLAMMPERPGDCLLRLIYRTLYCRFTHHYSPSSCYIFSCGSRFETLDRCDQLMTVPGGLTEFFNQLTLDHDKQSRADAQVFQIVGDQQHRCATIACLANHIEERLFSGHVYANGWRNRDQHLRIPGQRSPNNYLLLISPTQLPDLLV